MAASCALASLLFVFLNDRRRPEVGAVRIFAELAQRTPLTQEVPVAIELHTDGLETRVPRVVQFLAIPEPMFLVDQALDGREDRFVGFSVVIVIVIVIGHMLSPSAFIRAPAARR